MGDEATRVRDAVAADVAHIQAIYARHVLQGLASFEEVPPDSAEIASRMENVRAMGLPWLVAERGASVAGYAYAALYRTRSGYRYTLEAASPTFTVSMSFTVFPSMDSTETWPSR